MKEELMFCFGQARELYLTYGYRDMKCSYGWFKRWSQRFQVQRTTTDTKEHISMKSLNIYIFLHTFTFSIITMIMCLILFFQNFICCFIWFGAKMISKTITKPRLRFIRQILSVISVYIYHLYMHTWCGVNIQAISIQKIPGFKT